MEFIVMTAILAITGIIICIIESITEVIKARYASKITKE